MWDILTQQLLICLAWPLAHTFLKTKMTFTYFLFLPPHVTHRSKKQRKGRGPCLAIYHATNMKTSHSSSSSLSVFQTSNYSVDGNKNKSICLGKEKFLTLFYMDGVISSSKEVSSRSQLSQELAFIWQHFENPKFLKTWKQKLHALSCFLIVISFLAPESARVKSVSLHLFPQIFRSSIHLMQSSSTIAFPLLAIMPTFKSFLLIR